MIVAHSVAQAILRGAKTEMRRPRTSDTPPFSRDRQVIQYERPRTYEDAPAKHADDTTVVESVCHISITDRVAAVLGETSERDARAEGFSATKGITALHRFRLAWEELHGSLDPEQPVWVIRFDVEHVERPLYLARGGGYTQSRHLAIDETEAVPPAAVDSVNARRARGLGRDAQEEQAKRAARDRAARLRDSERKARVRGVDVGAELVALDRLLAEMRRKLDDDHST